MAFRLLSEWPEYEFGAGGFDVRGWPVRSGRAEPVGRVHDLVMDEAGEARYLDVRLGGGCVLLPIGEARVAEQADEVLVSGSVAERLQQVPSFSDDAEQVTPQYEAAVCAALDAGGRAEDGRGGEAPEPPAPRLPALSGSGGYRVAPGDEDPRGWLLVLAGAVAGGIVEDLVIDTEALKVRYLECSLVSGRKVLVPVVYARLDAERRHVILDAITRQAAERLPAFDGLPLAPEREEELHEAFTHGLTTGERHRHPRYSAQHFFGPRVRRGGRDRRRRRRAG